MISLTTVSGATGITVSKRKLGNIWTINIGIDFQNGSSKEISVITHQDPMIHPFFDKLYPEPLFKAPGT